jgi:hypothetical protein
LADEITVSVPRGRVDLVALKQPRLGGKEPSDDDYRVTGDLGFQPDGIRRKRRPALAFFARAGTMLPTLRPFLQTFVLLAEFRTYSVRVRVGSHFSEPSSTYGSLSAGLAWL